MVLLPLPTWPSQSESHSQTDQFGLSVCFGIRKSLRRNTQAVWQSAFSKQTRCWSQGVAEDRQWGIEMTGVCLLSVYDKVEIVRVQGSSCQFLVTEWEGGWPLTLTSEICTSSFPAFPQEGLFQAFRQGSFLRSNMIKWDKGKAIWEPGSSQHRATEPGDSHTRGVQGRPPDRRPSTSRFNSLMTFSKSLFRSTWMGNNTVLLSILQTFPSAPPCVFSTCLPCTHPLNDFSYTHTNTCSLKGKSEVQIPTMKKIKITLKSATWR